jgi:predicted metalloprotease with PDZ domain
VFTGGPAERAGLAPNDVLVALDGVRASTATINTLLADRAPGERVTVHAFRRDELIAVELDLAAPPLDTCYLVLRAEATGKAVDLRGHWLRG